MVKMTITEITESKFEIEFDADEVQKLKDIEAVFELPVKRMIRKSINENIRVATAGLQGIIDRLSNS